MTTTYTLIEKITVGAAGAATVNFTSIPQTYTDLKIVASTRDTYAAVSTAIYLEFNGNSSGYSMRRLRGSGSAVDSYSDSSQSTINLYNIKPGSSATASTFGNVEIYIPNYTGSANKSVSVDGVGENNATEAYAVLFAGLWGNTSAITSIKLYSETLFVQYSTFYLYGVAKEGVNPAASSAPYATGGDSIVFDGTYWIHTFTSSGTFTPKKNLTCDYLVVAGGAGGGAGSNGGTYAGGGGGAGGLRCTVTATGGGGSLESALALTANTGYTVTIGGGGAGTNSSSSKGTNGSNSVFSSITSTGGGGGGSYDTRPGSTGGSGGGAAYDSTGGAGTANQGYAGGNSTGVINGGGGGGGAGAAGATATGAAGANGGNGVATSITGSSVTYAGGGGGGGFSAGGTAGTGGGGRGGWYNTQAPGAGTANTGGGGGGYYAQAGTSGAGGSGIVIVRYAA